MEGWYTCESCGREAVYRKNHERWKTKCAFCWKEDKGIKYSVSDLYAMHLEDLLEIDKPPSPTQLPLDFIKQLITLCHPDKHGNSQKATTATQKLLAIRDVAAHAMEENF